MIKEKINKLPKQSTWIVIGLIILTLTLYLPFWLRKYTKILNQMLASNKIGSWWFPVSLSITVLSFGMIVPETITNDNSTVVAISNILSIIDFILVTIWILVVRTKLNVALAAEPDSPYWYNIGWTLVFTIFYLQYKTNKLHKLEETAVEQNAQPDSQ